MVCGEAQAGAPAEENAARWPSGAYSERCRSAFRGDGDRDSERMPITIPI
jgi:hypothetical protein